MFPVFSEIIDVYRYEISYQKEWFRVPDAERFEDLKGFEKIGCNLLEREIGLDAESFCPSCNSAVLLSEFLFNRPFECIKFFGENCESSSLSMSSECDEIIATFFEEFDNIDVFRTATTCHKFVVLSLECDSGLAKRFRESSCDEPDDSMFDIGGVVEKNSSISIDYLESVLDEVFCCGFSFAIEVFEFLENRVEFVFSCKQKRKCFVWTIHASGSIDSWPYMESDDIRIHFAIFPFYELPKPT